MRGWFKLSYLVALLWSTCLFAADSFVVKSIRVVGLKRLSKGTVYNYLPVQVGETLASEETASIIRELYDTGFFQSVRLEREGNTLIVYVVERATIGNISVIGNDEIPSDKMKDLLKQLGLIKGQVFQRASLEHLETELKQAYLMRGKYNAHVDAKVVPMTENRVGITITISEGRVSRIREIEIIGNHAYSSNELKAELSLQTSNLFTYFTKKDQYSKTSLDTSLEALRSFYLDRGYLKFQVISSQVLLSPDKKDVYIHIHIKEGAQYHFSGYRITGKTILPVEKLDRLVLVKKGEIFSRKKVTETVTAIGNALGDVGYGFPAINAEPSIDEANNTVLVTFVIEPGRHVYVRRIQFHGNTKTADYVLRSAIRQNEGALLSLHHIKESERQLRLLGYLKDVHVKTTPVPGANNQVDLDVDIEEAPSAEANASIGYGTNGPQFNAAFNQHNFLGTGRSMGMSFNASYWGQSYSINYFNPYYTRTGIGRGFSGYFETVDPKHLDVVTYSSDRFGGDVNYSLLLSEKSTLQFGYGYQGLDIKSTGNVLQIQNFVSDYGRNFQEIRFAGGWNRNTYDQMPYPHQGWNQQVSVLAAVPAVSSSFSYYKLGYQTRVYVPLFLGFGFTALGNLAYGNQFNREGLPFFENYFAGGIAQPGQVRGYESYSLGPLDNNGHALGGNFLANGNAGLILPYPLSRDVVRTMAFVDFGNAFSYDLPSQLQGTQAGPLRYSAGVSVEWRSPFGPLAFSVAKALNKQPFDQEQYFQFSLSSGF